MTTTLIPDHKQSMRKKLDYCESDVIEVSLLWSRAGGRIELEAWAQEALALGGDAHLEGMALLSLHWSGWSAGRESLATATERFRSAGMPREGAYATMCLGLDEAWATALHAAALMRDTHAGWHTLLSVVAALARSAGLQGDAGLVLRLAGALRSVSSELGLTMAVTRAAALEAAEASSREALDEQAVARAAAAGEAMTVESLLEYLRSLE